jgi:hypothetical protein
MKMIKFYRLKPTKKRGINGVSKNKKNNALLFTVKFML